MKLTTKADCSAGYRSRRGGRFRKPCRSRFFSHSSATQRYRKNPRTCFEGPFGEVLRATGPLAKVNLIRFSTQYTDDETDLVCYLHRYYNPNTGRWLSRDPIGEKGGFNVYGFALNDPENRIDPLGLHDCPAWAEYMTQHPPSEQTLEFMEAEAVVIGLLSPWPGDEGVAGATLAKKLKDCIGKCKNIRCMVRWHGKHHPFGGVKKCHLEFQCYVKGKSGKPNTIHIPLPDSLCPPWDSPQK